MSEDITNIAMADALMKIFGLKRVSPTDKELKEKYKEMDFNEVQEIPTCRETCNK